MTIQRVAEVGELTDRDLSEFVARAFEDLDIDDKRILFLIPDSTRSMPMPAMFRGLFDALRGRVAQMDYLIALGTHPPMSDDAIQKLLGISAEERQTTFADVGIFNMSGRTRTRWRVSAPCRRTKSPRSRTDSCGRGPMYLSTSGCSITT